MTQLVSHNGSNSAWTPEQVETIRRTVAVGATNEELKMFLHLAAKYDLDPFSREIWFVRMGDRNTIMTGRDGYLKIAHSSPYFASMQSDVVYENDKFRKTNDLIFHSYEAVNRGCIVGAYAMVWRFDKPKPFYFFAPMRDYNKGRGCWSQYGHAMILKVAEAMALKRAFPIAGLCTQEEVSPNPKFTSEQLASMAAFNPEHARADINVVSADDAVTVEAGNDDGANRAHDLKIKRKRDIWQAYLRDANDDAVSAERRIKRIIGNIPSKDWGITEMVTLEQALAMGEYDFSDKAMATEAVADVDEFEEVESYEE